MLVVDNVTKGFGNFIALTDLSFELGNGVYGLLAPNGAGKTTLIKMLATLLFPTKGSIRFEGKDIIAMGEEYRDLIGYLPQQFGFYKNDSPTDYLHYIAALKGLTKKEANQKIPELLELVALTEVAKKKMKKFSGGMIQRVGIAQALLNDPKILILDEPTAGLDPKERARFRNLLSQLSRDRIVLLSTHIVADVESIANEIIMIKDTKILYKESIGFLCNQLAGEIYETTLTFDELEVFKKNALSAWRKAGIRQHYC
ncbi:ABC transporter ATP-binding protein [Bacillus sp. JCM 19041]|uniref:ABC transporter ATP-binding protein n=1 Tax=Bacillus sp. JCM 19041 TaxID=1460637 RepID=UPI000A653E40